LNVLLIGIAYPEGNYKFRPRIFPLVPNHISKDAAFEGFSQSKTRGILQTKNRPPVHAGKIGSNKSPILHATKSEIMMNLYIFSLYWNNCHCLHAHKTKNGFVTPKFEK
jgi:hypothetical protein